MASSKQVLVLAVVATVACLASLASATVFVVGDGLGWSAKLHGWATGTTFVVGDGLLFKYNKGNHTVAQVSKDDFEACNLHGDFLGFWDSGNDVVTLDKPGKAWFICTKPNHCDGGMKLVVDVVAGTTAPAPSPWFPFRPFPGDPGVPANPPAVPAAPAPPPFLRSPFPWWWGSAPARPQYCRWQRRHLRP